MSEKLFKAPNFPAQSLTFRSLTRISCQRRCRDDRFVLAEVWALPHVVFEGALGLVAVQSGGVVLRIEAVVRRYSLQAVERGLAAPRLSQPVAALEAVNAFKRLLATELTWQGKIKTDILIQALEGYFKFENSFCKMWQMTSLCHHRRQRGDNVFDGVLVCFPT